MPERVVGHVELELLVLVDVATALVVVAALVVVVLVALMEVEVAEVVEVEALVELDDDGHVRQLLAFNVILVQPVSALPTEV